MTVKELVGLLNKKNPSALVVMSKDGEGNEFSPLEDVEVGRYVSDSDWSGYLSEDDDEDAKDAVILWPTN